jgi:hypothetical protein
MANSSIKSGGHIFPNFTEDAHYKLESQTVVDIAILKNL